MKLILILLLVVSCTGETPGSCEADLDHEYKQNDYLKQQLDRCQAETCDTGCDECPLCPICPRCNFDCDTGTGCETDTDSVLIQQLDSELQDCKHNAEETQSTLNSISEKYGACIADLAVCQGG